MKKDFNFDFDDFLDKIEKNVDNSKETAEKDFKIVSEINKQITEMMDEDYEEVQAFNNNLLNAFRKAKNKTINHAINIIFLCLIGSVSKQADFEILFFIVNVLIIFNTLVMLFFAGIAAKCNSGLNYCQKFFENYKELKSDIDHINKHFQE